ncbi:radical SAM protein [Candidatus Magnetaquicoccus inordinatus]|uniref:radical SAM protein n=1 Tax=Candidatus Magnetaquicoccus inordinatus TaxID=2496818 RepID=UPI00102B6C5F|nr:radical SAM protein [Candidatus Magnetaquicoccus inordinatus]
MIPSYLALYHSGQLARRVTEAEQRARHCDLCPRCCAVDRHKGERGASCHTGIYARVASAHAHFGEEEPLRGTHGSGTIFFSGCNLHCQYCQNWSLSHGGEGSELAPYLLARQMLQLQEQGCHNINFVSPTHVLPAILAALLEAIPLGFSLPLVYNSGGYDSLTALALLEGIIDIYMPDMKYSDAAIAERLSRIKDYPTHNRAAVKEMHRQVGDLQMDARGVAQRGLLVRHLVLPNGLAGTAETVRFLAEEISPHTYVNIMGQYHPCYHAERIPQLNRPLTVAEYKEAVALARSHGLRLDQRHRQAGMFL